MNKLIVISGASGMSGNETVRQLLKKGYKVLGFDNFFASSIASLHDVIDHPNFVFFEYDIRNKEQMDMLKKIIITTLASESMELHFINYAAVVHTKYFYLPEATFETNVLGMQSFLNMAIELKSLSYINCSTSEVYSLASYKEGGVCENDALMLATAEVSQRTSYATGKLMTEFFMKEAVDNGKIKGCSIRFANVYSNDELLSEHIIPYVIDRIANSDVVKLLTNAKETHRTFLHNFDSCAAVIALLEASDTLDGSIYNVGTEEEILIPDLVRKIATMMDKEDVKIVYEGHRTADPARRVLNTAKIRSKTTWHPMVALDEGLRMCINFRSKK